MAKFITTGNIVLNFDCIDYNSAEILIDTIQTAIEDVIKDQSGIIDYEVTLDNIDCIDEEDDELLNDD